MSSMPLTLQFRQGEHRRIKLKVSVSDMAPFVIQTASYKLLSDVGTLVDSGDCTIDNDDKTLTVWFSATENGTYHLVLTFGVADETFVRLVVISVS